MTYRAENADGLIRKVLSQSIKFRGVEGSVGTVQRVGKITDEAALASPKSTRQRIIETIDRCAREGTRKDGILPNVDFINAFREFFEAHPEYKTPASIFALEKLVQDEGTTDLEYLFALPGVREKFLTTPGYRDQQAVAAENQRLAALADERRNQLFDHWTNVNAPHYRNNRFGWEHAQKLECNRLNDLPDSEIHAIWERREAVTKLRNAPTPTEQERQRNKELIGLSTQGQTQQYPKLPAVWYPKGSFQGIPLNRQMLLKLANEQRHIFRHLATVYGQVQIDAVLNSKD